MPIENVPAIISSYFAAKGGDNVEETIACFANDATVWDNGEDRELNGIESIRDWMTGTVSGYKLTSEVVSGEHIEDAFVAGVVVAGDFPGSPYKFEYRFKLKDNKIAELIIDPIGSLSSASNHLDDFRSTPSTTSHSETRSPSAR